MIISALPDPEKHHLWPGIRRLLKRGGDWADAPDWEPEHVVWIVIDGRQIIAALSSRVTVDGAAEVVNIGGCRAAEWLPDMDDHITGWARRAGATKLAARGRRGWQRLSAPLGWVAIGRDGKSMLYEKVL